MTQTPVQNSGAPILFLNTSIPPPGVNQGTPQQKSKMTRRASMSVAMQAVYDNNPGIAAIGVDVVSRPLDSDTVQWSREQSQRLNQTHFWESSARRQALTV